MAETPDLSKYPVLVCGIDPVSRGVIDGVVDVSQVTEIPYDLDAFADAAEVPNLAFLLFGTPPAGTSMMEVAQVARMKYPSLPIWFVTSTRTNFDRFECQKNGFTDAFLVPIDSDVLRQTLREELTRATRGLVRSFRPVSLIDLRPNEELEFDTYLYLPVNRKHLRISVAGDSLDEKQYAKLSKTQVNAVRVPTDQMPHFYEHAGRKLRELHAGVGMTETERRERMTGAIRGLMASVFNDDSTAATIEQGRSLIGDCQQIVRAFIVGNDKSNDWYEKMLRVTGAEASTYNHSGNVATFGALFALASGAAKPEDVALAGLLHDMGIADIPPAVQSKEATARTRDEEEEYQKHVEHTLNIIKFRKMILPEPVTKAIAQHHERWSGTGYPKGYAGARISKEAQLLALADEFDYRTMTRDGHVRLAPALAFQTIYEESVNDPANAKFDVEFLKQFLSIFPEEASA
jgi:HD-GYP domain-containing protein (c-di-GMP phosphodiesterase class II)